MFDCIKTKKESLTKLLTPIISLNIQLFSFTEEDLKSKPVQGGILFNYRLGVYLRWGVYLRPVSVLSSMATIQGNSPKTVVVVVASPRILGMAPRGLGIPHMAIGLGVWIRIAAAVVVVVVVGGLRRLQHTLPGVQIALIVKDKQYSFLVNFFKYFLNLCNIASLQNMLFVCISFWSVWW